MLGRPQVCVCSCKCLCKCKCDVKLTCSRPGYSTGFLCKFAPQFVCVTLNVSPCRSSPSVSISSLKIGFHCADPKPCPSIWARLFCHRDDPLILPAAFPLMQQVCQRCPPGAVCPGLRRLLGHSLVGESLSLVVLSCGNMATLPRPLASQATTIRGNKRSPPPSERVCERERESWPNGVPSSIIATSGRYWQCWPRPISTCSKRAPSRHWPLECNVRGSARHTETTGLQLAQQFGRLSTFGRSHSAEDGGKIVCKRVLLWGCSVATSGRLFSQERERERALGGNLASAATVQFELASETSETEWQSGRVAEWRRDGQ